MIPCVIVRVPGAKARSNCGGPAGFGPENSDLSHLSMAFARVDQELLLVRLPRGCAQGEHSDSLRPGNDLPPGRGPNPDQHPFGQRGLFAAALDGAAALQDDVNLLLPCGPMRSTAEGLPVP